MRQRFTRSENGGPLQEYWCRYTPAAEQLAALRDAIEKKGVSVYFEFDFPTEWQGMSTAERQEFVAKTPLDIIVQAIFCRAACTATDEDLLVFLGKCEHLDILRLRGPEVTIDSLQLLESASHPKTLKLNGPQFGDDVVKRILALSSLRVIDLVGSAISADGIQIIRSAFPAPVEIFIDTEPT